MSAETFEGHTMEVDETRYVHMSDRDFEAYAAEFPKSAVNRQDNPYLNVGSTVFMKSKSFSLLDWFWDYLERRKELRKARQVYRDKKDRPWLHGGIRWL